MVCTLNKLADVFHFINPVYKVISIHDCSVFKGIFHITTFFVTTFFVVAAKKVSETEKKMAGNLMDSSSVACLTWGAKVPDPVAPFLFVIELFGCFPKNIYLCRLNQEVPFSA
jgi:hypothetical protein